MRRLLVRDLVLRFLTEMRVGGGDGQQQLTGLTLGEGFREDTKVPTGVLR